VFRGLRAQGAPVAILDPRALPSCELAVRVAENVEGMLRLGPDELALDDVTGVYIRATSFRQFADVVPGGPACRAWQHAAAVEYLLGSWLEITPARVVNRLSDMAPNCSKPFQGEQLRALGFAIPDTLLTTDADAARQFIARHRGRVIVKPISAMASVVSRIDDGAMQRLGELDCCPVQLQEQVTGVDYRVHVVGDEVFTCRIISEADDYRHPERQGLTTQLVADEVPAELAERCRGLARRLRLPVTGIDLRRTPGGAWYCFEANPNPAFEYYERVTRQPIGDAIARWLVRGAPADRTARDERFEIAGARTIANLEAIRALGVQSSTRGK
jgi:hypothetical protein